MGANPIRWLLLLAVILAILGAIQCPSTPKRFISNSLRSFGNTVVRTLSRNRSGSSSRSGRGGASDGEHSGTESDVEQPASGNYSGGGRLPRSRSSSPPARGGGGASSSSSSSETAVIRMYGALRMERINAMCRVVNDAGDAHVVTNMQVSIFASIIREMKRVAVDDECRRAHSTISRENTGTVHCQEMFVEFKKIPRQYRGECSEAVAAQCLAWHGPTRQQEQRKCTFFVKTSMRSATRIDGYWVDLTDCIKGIKDELFMDHQLASVGINPPKSPPKPLLPSDYSPEH